METRRERKKQHTRAALLDAAMALFAERGIYGTRVEDITERVDLGKGAFYNYFPSKEALVADLVAEAVATFEEAYLSRMRGTSVIADRVGELVRLCTAFTNEHPRYALLLHQARGLLILKEAPMERLREAFVAYLGSVGQALIDPQKKERLPDEDLLDIAAALLGGVAGYRSFQLAAALLPNASTAEGVLAPGIQGLVEQWENGQFPVAN